jgi:hypothetical protein
MTRSTILSRKVIRCCLDVFLAYQHSLEAATGDVDYKAITQANLDSYCVSPAYRATLYQPTMPHHLLLLPLHLICQRLHPNLRTFNQLLFSVVPSRRILHSFRL